jgi:signal transduction histidine kinase
MGKVKAIGCRGVGGTEITYARADWQMLERVVQNLISNSIKYLDGSEVRFAITEKDDIILVVSNLISETVDTE